MAARGRGGAAGKGAPLVRLERQGDDEAVQPRHARKDERQNHSDEQPRLHTEATHAVIACDARRPARSAPCLGRRARASMDGELVVRHTL